MQKLTCLYLYIYMFIRPWSVPVGVRCRRKFSTRQATWWPNWK